MKTLALTAVQMGALLTFIIPLIIVVIILAILASNIRVVQQSKAVVIERLGAFHAVWGVGLHFKIPFLERAAKTVSLKDRKSTRLNSSH